MRQAPYRIYLSLPCGYDVRDRFLVVAILLFQVSLRLPRRSEKPAPRNDTYIPLPHTVNTKFLAIHLASRDI